MSRIRTIELRFPNLTTEDKENNNYIFELLNDLENIKKTENEILLSKNFLFPKILFKRSSINNPVISFFTPGIETRCWQIGNLNLGFNLNNIEETLRRARIKLSFKIHKDYQGEYLEIESFDNSSYFLTTKQLFERLRGKLIELNHTGVNFGPPILKQSDYLEIKKVVARNSSLYNYPTGEEWPFIVPSFDEEFKNDIENTQINRNPMFELVYSRYHPTPLIQLDIETNLNKNELLELIPNPYGISFKGLEDIFRSVFVFMEWEEILLRFDLRVKTDGSDFSSWLITSGERHKT